MDLKKEENLRISYQSMGIRDFSQYTLIKYPPPYYLIDQIIMKGTVSILGGVPGIGKSIIALSIIKSLLTGEPLWGRFQVFETGPVILVDEENPAHLLSERLQLIGIEENLSLHLLFSQGVRLDEESYFDAFMRKLEEVKPILVVIDSLIRVHRQNENDNTEMARVIEQIRRIANWGTTVLLIHHYKKGETPLIERFRGASEIIAGVDIQYALIRTRYSYLIFKSVKTRTVPLPPIKLRFEISNKKIEIISEDEMENE
jgi:hypothetical protein